MSCRLLQITGTAILTLFKKNLKATCCYYRFFSFNGSRQLQATEHNRASVAPFPPACPLINGAPVRALPCSTPPARAALMRPGATLDKWSHEELSDLGEEANGLCHL